MHKKKTWMLRVGSPIVIALAVVIVAGCGRSVASAESAEEGAVKPTVLTKENFEAEVKQAEGLVVVDFWATWCGPCRVIAPRLRELAVEYEGRVKICKLDIDKNPELARKYKVQGIPYLVMFKDGKVIDAKVGADRKKNYAAWFDANL